MANPLRTFIAPIIATCLLLAGAEAAHAATITVTTTAQAGPGCTLTNAIKSANLDVAVGGCEPGTGADVIHVPAGVYVLSTPEIPDDGYPWTAVALPYITTPLVIEGEGQNVTIIRRDSEAPAFRFLYVSEFDGFELRDLTLSNGLVTNYRGGALYSSDRPITARRVRFENNRAQSGGALGDTGFFGTQGSRYLVEDCVFVGNTATLGGGGILVSPGGELVVRRTLFTDNHADQWGGAIQAPDGASVFTQIEDSEFLRNTAPFQTGGAIYASSPSITNTIFRENASRDRGGALYSYGGRPNIVDSTFHGNVSRQGGAIEVLAGSIEISSSTFSANEASGAGFQNAGGALYLDDRTGTSRITNSTFSGNRVAAQGSAINLSEGGLTLINSTVAFNTNTPGGWGYGIHMGFFGTTTLRVSNSIIAHNSFDGAAADIGSNPNEHISSLGHNIVGSADYSYGAFVGDGDVAGTNEAPVEAGLLPLVDNGGPTQTHALSSGSIALDAGSNQPPGSDAACLAVDQRGAARPGAGTPRCDVGAFEREITYPLTLAVGPGGSVSGAGPAACSGGCSTQVIAGADVTLSAAPLDGFSFAGWSGACAGPIPTCTFTMSAARDVGATFAAENAATTTTITASANPTSNPVTLTAVVTASVPAGIEPTGSVQFVEVTTPRTLGVATLENGTASIEIDDFTIGDHEVRAIYLGDSHFESSSATLPLTVTSPEPVSVELTETIAVADSVVRLPSAMVVVQETIGIDDAVVPLPSAMVQVDDNIGVSDTPTVVVQNTPPGNNIGVNPHGSVSLLFTTVTTAGDTVAVPQSGPPAPTGFQPTVPPSSFAITTTAEYTGATEVCLTHPPAAVSPRLMHFESGFWIDRTSSSDNASNTVCGSVDSLSPFAVFVPVAQKGRMTGQGGLAGDAEFTFGVSERSLGDERGTLTFERKTPRSGKHKGRTDQFKATRIDDIWFWDDPTYRPASRRPKPTVDSVVFTGTGRWNGVRGYTFEVEACDEGEPGRGRDTFSITIRNPQGSVVSEADGTLMNGNIQSLRLAKRR